MKIVINFPSDAKMKDIVKVATALTALEDEGYEFETVVGTPPPVVNNDPQGLAQPPDSSWAKSERVDAPKGEDFDWMSLIDQDVPGSADQVDPNLTRRAFRVADDATGR
jgi:hypothetical protein